MSGAVVVVEPPLVAASDDCGKSWLKTGLEIKFIFTPKYQILMFEGGACVTKEDQIPRANKTRAAVGARAHAASVGDP